MSDEPTSEPSPQAPQHAENDECSVSGNCAYHQLLHAKVRSVEIDGDRYVSLEDVAHWIDVNVGWQITTMASGFPPADAGQVAHLLHTALMNFGQGASFALESVERLMQQEVKPMSELTGTLVSPEDFKSQVPDEVPTAWTQEGA